MAGVFRDETSIYIVAADTAGSELASSDKVVGEIRNFNVSGLEQEDDMKTTFGGQIKIKKPRTMGEVAFEVSVQNTSAETLDRWDTLKYPSGLSNESTPNKAVFITHLTNGIWKTTGINNAAVTVGETDMPADEELMKNVTLRFNAETDTGSANLKTSTLAPSDGFFNWS